MENEKIEVAVITSFILRGIAIGYADFTNSGVYVFLFLRRTRDFPNDLCPMYYYSLQQALCSNAANAANFFNY